MILAGADLVKNIKNATILINVTEAIRPVQFESTLSQARRVLEAVPLLEDSGLIEKDEAGRQRKVLEETLKFIEVNELGRQI